MLLEPTSPLPLSHPHLIRARTVRGNFDRRQTAGYIPLLLEFLGRIAPRIINKVSGINRVVYDVTLALSARSSGSKASSKIIAKEVDSITIKFRESSYVKRNTGSL